MDDKPVGPVMCGFPMNIAEEEPVYPAPFAFHADAAIRKAGSRCKLEAQPKRILGKRTQQLTLNDYSSFRPFVKRARQLEMDSLCLSLSATAHT
jgi:hypothetical protein